MMLGIVFGATLSGQLLSRTGGHYRIQAVIGTGLMLLGAILISTMNPETNFPRAVGYIIVLGVGLGVTFPTFTLSVQNSVPFRLMGIIHVRAPILSLDRGNARTRRTGRDDGEQVRLQPGADRL